MSINGIPLRSVCKMLRMIVSEPGKALNSIGVMDSLAFPVAVVDREGKIISINGRWREPSWRNGFSGDLSVGANYLQICCRAAASGHLPADEALKGIRSVCDGSIPSYQLDYPCPSPAGERWFSMTVRPLLGREGAAVVTYRDISDLKRIQAGLRESEERFLLIAGKAPAMIWVAAADKRFTYFNNQWLDFTGRQLDQELGNGWMEGVHPDDTALFEAVLGESFENRQNFRLEHRLRCANGDFRWVLNTGVPLFKGNAEFIGFIGSCLDITDRRATEEMLVDLNGRLIKAQERERGRIARELHDNLSQEMALLAIDIEQLVQLPSRGPAVTVGLRKVLNRLQEISSEIHRMSYELHPSKLDRLGLAAATLSLCKEISSQQSLQLNCDFKNIPDSLPRDVALCLYRVIQESLQNIMKHSGACDATVELHGSPSEIRLRITDEGVGFDPESAARKQGLGLLSMRERVRLVGGTISIESEPLRGTQIKVVVPLGAKSLTSPLNQTETSHL